MFKKISGFFLVFMLGAFFTYLLFKGWDILPSDEYKLNLDTLISGIGIIVSLLAVLIVFWSTNIQIRNHNKENHRPYIATKKLSMTSEEDLELIINYNVKFNEDEGQEYKSSYFEISNNGYGIAVNIMIIGLKYKVKDNFVDIVPQDYTTKNHLLDYLNSESTKKIKLGLLVDANNTFLLPINLMLFYSDLNENTYSTLIKFEKIGNSRGYTTNFFQCNTRKYNDELKKLAYNYKDIEKHYKSKVYGN